MREVGKEEEDKEELNDEEEEEEVFVQKYRKTVPNI